MQTHDRLSIFFILCLAWLYAFVPTVAQAADRDISGIVVDSAGQPLAEVPLVLHVLVTDEQGHRHWQEKARTVTDQAGNYSFTDITAAVACLPSDPQCLAEQAGAFLAPQRNLLIAPDATTQATQSYAAELDNAAPKAIPNVIPNAAADPNVGLKDSPAVDDTTTLIYRVDLAHAAAHTPLELMILETATTPQSAQATAQGQINGTVLGDNTQPASNIAVSLYRLERYPDYTFEQIVRRTITNENGNYNIRNLSPGDYKVGFADVFLPERYVTEYYDDRRELYDATVISVNEETVPINATLAQAGLISGVVYDPNGQPAKDIAINVVRFMASSGNYESQWGSFYTTTDGYYEIGGLPAGTYRLIYSDNAWPNRFLPRYYANTSEWNEATDIELASGEIRRNVDVLLTTGGKVAGTVTSSNGEPLSDIYVSLYYRQFSNDSDEWYWNHAQSGRTNAEGKFEVTALPTGTYLVEFTDYSWPRRHQAEYYDDVYIRDEATLIDVQEGATTTGINAQLAALGQLQGRVTIANGQAVGDAAAIAYTMTEDGTWYPAGSMRTDSAGHYTIHGLTPGRYRVGFTFPYNSWPKLFYNQVARIEDANEIELAPDSTVTGINAEFPIPGAISGQVVDSTGTPLAGIAVTALYSARYENQQVGWFDGSTTFTDENGYYTIAYLMPDDYVVRFWDASWENRSYSTIYYGDTTESTTAARVRVNANAMTDAINGQMFATETISGQVTDEAGQPAANIIVEAYQQTVDYQGNPYWNYLSGAATNEEGNYTLFGLNVGQYRVSFIDTQWPSRFVREYYDDAIEFHEAQSISVGANAPATGIDAQLSEGSQIRGRITGADGMEINPDTVGMQLYRAQVDEAGETRWDYYYSDAQSLGAGGTYTISVLPAGRYRLYVIEWSGRYEPTYYGDTTELESATDIAVDGETATTNIDVQLITKTPVTPPVRTEPVAHNDLITVTVATTLTQQVTVTGSVLANDQANDASNTLTAELVTDALFGTVTLQPNGQVLYTPAGPVANVPGIDLFTYRVHEGDKVSNTAVAFILLPEGNRNGALRILLPLLTN